jgi:hypothetical protein
MLRWLRERLRRRNERPPTPHAELTSDGFAVVFPDGSRSEVRWASVIAVVTYKYDLLTSDEIVIAFEVLERPGVLQEVSEEWAGFQVLCDQLECELGLSPDWYQEVMLPPFETNYRVLLQRTPTLRDDKPGPG